MRSHARRLVPCAVLFGCASLLALARPARAFDEVDDAKFDVLVLEKKLRKGQAITPADARAFRKKNDDLVHVMHLFKPVAKRGYGIEKAVNDLADPRKPLDKAGLKKQQGALARMALTTRAISEVLPAYADTMQGANKRKSFQQFAKDLNKAAIDLGKAAQANDVPAVRKAAARLKDSCVNCHGL
jgi:hypothetical protein